MRWRRPTLTLLAVIAAVCLGSTLAMQPIVKAAESNTAAAESADYWIGIVCAVPEPVVRAQFGLAEDEGLVVVGVAKGSPAEKAGIKQYDIIVRVNGKPVKGIESLQEAVRQADGQKEITLEIIRKAKHQKVAVKPAKRPEEEAIQWPAPPPVREMLPEEIERWMKRWMQRWPQAPGPLRFRFYAPGRIVPPGTKGFEGTVTITTKKDGLQIVIVKEGEKPAKIVVSRGGKKWTVTENELDKLPEDIRQQVEEYLNSIVVDSSVELNVEPFWSPLRQRELDRQLKDLKAQLEKLQKQVEQLQKLSEGKSKE